MKESLIFKDKEFSVYFLGTWRSYGKPESWLDIKIKMLDEAGKEVLVSVREIDKANNETGQDKADETGSNPQTA